MKKIALEEHAIAPRLMSLEVWGRDD